MDNTVASVDLAILRRLKQSLRQQYSYLRSAERTIVAAVCYRQSDDGEIEFLLVRTRSGRWTFPKGGVDSDRTAAAAAAREAHEEAGVRGDVSPFAFTSYRHSKSGGDEHSVGAHLCRVHAQETPRELYRTPRWFSAEKAKRRLREDRHSRYGDELERVVDKAVRCIVSSRLHADPSYLN
jgi:8-oxo-dGTP pyrophosphatase MutT (NUDIX family)